MWRTATIYQRAEDLGPQLKQEVANVMMEDNAFRKVLKKHVFYSTAEDDVNGRMESTFTMLLEIEQLWDRFKKAENKELTVNMNISKW